jgi:hypothetical protein
VPTLCTEWRVRHVVAHVFSYDELRKLGLVGRFLRRGLIPDRVNAVGVAAYADRSPDELIALAKNNLQPRGLTAGFGGRIALTDGTIHHQGHPSPPRPAPPDIPAAARHRPRLRQDRNDDQRRQAHPRLTLTATDLDWTKTALLSRDRPSRCSWPSPDDAA